MGESVAWESRGWRISSCCEEAGFEVALVGNSWWRARWGECVASERSLRDSWRDSRELAMSAFLEAQNVAKLSDALEGGT